MVEDRADLPPRRRLVHPAERGIERRAQLEPQTIEVLERSMTLIDQAITESRAALAKDPASQFLAAQLARSYSTKLTLLRSTATMPVGT